MIYNSHAITNARCSGESIAILKFLPHRALLNVKLKKDVLLSIEIRKRKKNL